MQIGIALPVVGQDEFIGDALRSLKAQRAAYHLAVMDATPSDSVQNILHDYQDIITYNRHGPDAGQAAAIVEGWERIDADILAWLCADDYYFPYTLTEVQHIFATRADVDVVYGDTVFVDKERRFLGYFPEISPDVSILPKSCCISQPSCFVRREAIERVGGLSTDLHYIMDWDLWTRLYLTGARFYYLKKPLSVCRMYETTKTGSRSLARYKEINAHLRKFTPPRTRIRSLIGFYYQDLFTRRTSWFDHVSYKILSGVPEIQRWLATRRGQPSGSLTLYGFEQRTNIVRDWGHVYMPWFQKTDRCIADICVDREVTLEVELYGERLETVSCQRDGSVYRASILITDIRDQMVSFALRAADSSAQWGLKAVELKPCH